MTYNIDSGIVQQDSAPRAFAGSGEGPVPARLKVRALTVTPTTERSTRHIVSPAKSGEGREPSRTSHPEQATEKPSPIPNNSKGAPKEPTAVYVKPESDGAVPKDTSAAPKKGISQEELLTAFEAHRKELFGTALRVTGNWQDAEDLMQETFVNASLAADNYAHGNIGGWFHRICVNRGLDMHRKNGRNPVEMPDDGALPEPLTINERSLGDPEGHMEKMEVAAEVKGLLAQVQPEFADLVLMADGYDLTYEQIAAIKGRPIGTIKSGIHRGRARLRSLKRDQATE